MTVTAFAPGRVNLIGDHVDYMGGPVLPMAVQLGTTVTGEESHGAGRLVLRSDRLAGTLDLPLPVTEPSTIEPRWGRYPAAVASALATRSGFDGSVSSDLPIGGGLSSSASIEVATALALGAGGTPLQLARLCRDAEQQATGVPCGIMDQLAVAGGVEGHALLMDCATGATTPVPIPEQVAIWVVDSGQERELASSAYAERRAQAEAAAELVGPLPTASMAEIESIADPLLRRRARHVRTECDRVHAFAAALVAGDTARAGQLMAESHRSLRDDYDVSTDLLDRLVARLIARPLVHGARLTGAGFGGCVVVLTDPEESIEGGIRVRPSAGARVIRWDGRGEHGLGARVAEHLLDRRSELPTRPDGVVLTGERVRLRPATLDDAGALHRISDGGAVERFGRSVGAYDPEEAVWRYMPVGPFADEEAFASFLSSMLDHRDRRVFVVEDRSTAEPLGSMSLLSSSPADLRVEIGAVWCTPAVQGTGVIRESCRLLLDHLFALGYVRVDWKCHAGNARSVAAATRLGFRFEGVQERHSIQKGRYRDTAWFRLLRDEWNPTGR